MNEAQQRTVYRYFELADAFVQIAVCDAERLALSEAPTLNRTAYRRMVIDACLPQLEGGAEAYIQDLFPDDPLLAEDLLYQLCVEVNPELDIHTVRIYGELNQNTEPQSARQDKQTRHFDVFLDDFRRRVRGLEGRLAEQISGQPTAIKACARAVSKAAAGLGSESRPLATLMFAGRTGTGKTETARVLADLVYGASSKRPLVRIDCSEFGSPHDTAKLIGAPPGYVGHEEGGQLTEALSKNPESLVLFDEIEKAHPRLHHMLLQILEEGELTDGRGRTVHFDRSTVILTSNVGAQQTQQASRSIGFDGPSTLNRKVLETITTQALEDSFAPEFLGRIDEILLFGDLDTDAARRIARRQLTHLAARARKRGFRVAFTPAVARWVADRGFSEDYGAREIRRVIQREIEPKLSELFLAGPLPGESLVRVRIDREALVLRIED